MNGLPWQLNHSSPSVIQHAAAAQQVYAERRKFMRQAPTNTQISIVLSSHPDDADMQLQIRLLIKSAQCGSSRYLEQCPEFIEMPVVSTNICVDRLRVCYLCLKPNHQAKMCRSRHACGLQLCVGNHHLLVHRLSSSKPENEPEPPGIASEGAHHGVSKSNISLAVVPVRILGPKETSRSTPFLDNSASTTLIPSSFLPKLGLKRILVSLINKTITWKCVNYLRRKECISTSFPGYYHVSYDSPDDGNSIFGDRELQLSSTEQQVEKSIAGVNSEE
ncbi:hypothetical protein T265_05431 [Opisthorchis viverrini]|uniref:CCHC-type domain-containing protein n=1 Tax=Opisthorchis viverrini TaxID=6198 RepID=A0A074ZKH2_OPIVI|nr:hypothetical protein T265_05431 [Opisthorchis viverrini]KER27541.1 hypothetical protein T265_05431 [Opisthorchis viverrini]